MIEYTKINTTKDKNLNWSYCCPMCCPCVYPNANRYYVKLGKDDILRKDTYSDICYIIESIIPSIRIYNCEVDSKDPTIVTGFNVIVLLNTDSGNDFNKFKDFLNKILDTNIHKKVIANTNKKYIDSISGFWTDVAKNYVYIQPKYKLNPTQIATLMVIYRNYYANEYIRRSVFKPDHNEPIIKTDDEYSNTTNRIKTYYSFKTTTASIKYDVAHNIIIIRQTYSDMSPPVPVTKSDIDNFAKLLKAFYNVVLTNKALTENNPSYLNYKKFGKRIFSDKLDFGDPNESYDFETKYISAIRLLKRYRAIDNKNVVHYCISFKEENNDDFLSFLKDKFCLIYHRDTRFKQSETDYDVHNNRYGYLIDTQFSNKVVSQDSKDYSDHYTHEIILYAPFGMTEPTAQMLRDLDELASLYYENKLNKTPSSSDIGTVLNQYIPYKEFAKMPNHDIDMGRNPIISYARYRNDLTNSKKPSQKWCIEAYLGYKVSDEDIDRYISASNKIDKYFKVTKSSALNYRGETVSTLLFFPKRVSKYWDDKTTGLWCITMMNLEVFINKNTPVNKVKPKDIFNKNNPDGFEPVDKFYNKFKLETNKPIVIVDGYIRFKDELSL